MQGDRFVLRVKMVSFCAKRTGLHRTSRLCTRMGSRLVLGAEIDPRIKIAGRIEMPKRPRAPFAHPVPGRA